MSTNSPQFEKLKSVLQLVQSQVTKEEFVQAFDAVLKIVRGIKSSNEAQLASMRQQVTELASKVSNDSTSELSNIKKIVMDYCAKEMQVMMKEHDTKMQEADARMDALQDSKEDMVEGVASEMLTRLPPYPIVPEPLLGEDMRNALEALPGDDRLSISAIKDLQEELAKLKRELNTRIDSLPRGGARSSHSTRLTDLSSQTNGSLKVFAVPEGLAGLLFSSDFPSVLMEGNGFSLNKTRTQLTMTTDNAPSAGSQLVYQSVDIANTY